jgi:hypothetical protein
MRFSVCAQNNSKEHGNCKMKCSGCYLFLNFGLILARYEPEPKYIDIYVLRLRDRLKLCGSVKSSEFGLRQFMFSAPLTLRLLLYPYTVALKSLR